jgi:hypothetical protein
MVVNKVVKLNTGAEMPVLGLGASTFLSPLFYYRTRATREGVFADLICVG